MVEPYWEWDVLDCFIDFIYEVVVVGYCE